MKEPIAIICLTSLSILINITGLMQEQNNVFKACNVGLIVLMSHLLRNNIELLKQRKNNK